MPLQTACSSCSAKIKVKDELIGKSIKCPKCAKVFKAVGEGAQTAVKAEAKKPAAAWDDGDDDSDGDKKSAAWDKKSKNGKDDTKKKPPAKKTKAADDDDEEEEREPDAEFDALLAQTLLPDSTKKMIQGELGLREKGIWVGQPDMKIMTVRGLAKVVGAVFALTVVCFIIGFGLAFPLEGYWWIATGGGILLWLIGVPVFSAGILFFERKKARATAYVITNKRCICFTGGWFSGPGQESFYPDLLQHMRRMQSWVFGADAGDLVFRSVTTITTTHHRRGGTSTSVSTTYYGFLGIRNLDEIERKIRQALLSADDDDDEDDDDDDEDEPKKKKKKKKRKDDDDDDD